MLWWRFSDASNQTVELYHKWENEFSLSVLNNNHNTEKEMETQDFYVKIQIGKNHGEEDENSL